MKYVIIGGDAAGMSAAMQIVRNEPDASIVTLEMGGIYSYAQCGLPYIIGGHIPTTEKLIARDVETFRNEYGIDARTFPKVTSVDSENKLVKGINLETDKKFSISYDKLLVATGAEPIVPDWPGKELKGIHTIKTIPDVEKLMQELNDSIQHVTIVGGGYIGLEMAENFTDLNKQVMVIEQGPHLAMMFDEDVAKLIHEEAAKQGIDVRLNESVQAFVGTDTIKAVTTDKGKIQTDLVIVSIGVRPNTGILKDTGVHLNDKGAVIVNNYTETNIPDIYAAGDCATHYHRVKEKLDYIPLGTHANKQGRVAGMNMIEQTRVFQGVVGTSILKFHDLSLARTGLSIKEANELHLAFETVTLEIPHIAGYYPGPEKLTVKLLYHSTSRKLLGAQIIGKSGVDKRIDVVATALFHKMTIDELEDLDLAYAPPYNGVWDPIQQAARRAK
ncbi:FAD-dependent oxidoreductase [Bacillus sp. FJAT-45350]|uniref:FAD-dependent oxidoreductase n=1 Tax=Bacillus sp. FJAT-45350 TaxID=2011014 RepID=UPI000BB93522|nr:FAD-dependent oxidoreductase [Bacillus sp. FJAT-45350]